MEYSISFENNEAIQSIRSMANINLIERFNLRKKWCRGRAPILHEPAWLHAGPCGFMWSHVHPGAFGYFEWFYMNPHGCMPVHVDSCGFMCTPVHLGFSHDFTWTHMVACRFMWIHVDSCAPRCLGVFHMNSYEYMWFYMDACGSIWPVV